VVSFRIAAHVALSVVASIGIAHAQDVHVRVSPDVKTGIESTTVFPTIQMALDHHPWPGLGGRVYIEIAPGVYRERIIVTQNHENITLLGTGKSPADVHEQPEREAGGRHVFHGDC
jgi:pectinesterase